MANNFPPIPIYPKNYDSDYTLFLVHNTSETITTVDNLPWSEEISIKPVHPDKDEIWAENGYANIEGELFYYDAVDYNEFGKINKFKKCVRNLGNKKTKFNKAGSEVRGFVIAEHHNQIVDAIIKIEDFIGENFTTNQETLDWRIRNLRELEVIFDDFTCPDVTFFFSVDESNPASGVLATFDIQIDGPFTGYRLDFGDGSFTTTTTSGTHRYAPSAKIDPVVTVTTEKCTIVQTPIERTEATEPTIEPTEEVLEIRIPNIPDIPPIVIPTPTLPSLTVNPPPLVTPCINLGSIGDINIPSIVTFEPEIDIPSIITFVNVPSFPILIEFGPFPSFPVLIEFGPFPTFPVLIEFGPFPSFPTLIEFGPAPSIPTLIEFGPAPSIPTQITFGPAPSIPTIIEFGPAPSIPTLIEFGPAPSIPTLIEFGPAPLIPTIITFGPAPAIPTLIEFGPAPSFCQTINFGPAPSIPTLIEFGPAPSIPTMITFGPAPSIPTTITFGPAPSIPTTINFGPAPSIPTTINFGPAPSIPTTITFGPAPSIPTTITFGPAPNLTAMIEFGSFPSFPGTIEFGSCSCSIPATIEFGSCPACPAIEFGPAPSIPDIIFSNPPSIPDISWGTPPSVSVVWGTPPACNCTVEIVCPSSSPFAARFGAVDYSDPSVDVQIADLGIPSIIKVLAPEMQDIRIVHDVPTMIKVEAMDVPKSIRLNAEEVPKFIKLINQDVPTEIKLVSDLPKSITLDATQVPRSIMLEVPDNFPKSIKLDASGIPDKIQVVGVPEHINLVGNIPSEIRLIMPDKPEVELVYKGAPIDVKIQLDVNRLTGEGEKLQCVAIVPCAP